MQRPVNLGERAELTDAELAQRESQAKKQASEDGEEFAKGRATSPLILLRIGWSAASRSGKPRWLSILPTAEFLR